jgi:catechol 2,3-dioxygenase-like lactoylglutathione lyase family enzyme
VAAWYVDYLGAFRGTPTKRSENLWYGGNLVQVQSRYAVEPSGEVDHLGLGTPDVQGAITRVIAAGGQRLDRDFITDPFGTRIQLVQAQEWCFHHAELVAREPQQLADWYALNFGGKVVVCPWDADKLAIAYDSMWLVLRSGEPRNDPPGRPICHCGWYTENMQKTVGEMMANGCQFAIPPRQFGAVQIAFVEDPSGLLIELVEPSGEHPRQLKNKQ